MIVVPIMRMCSVFISIPIKNVGRDFDKYPSCIHQMYSSIHARMHSFIHNNIQGSIKAVRTTK